MMGCQAHHGGRICPHQCDTDDDVEILGANLAASAMHVAAVHETEHNDKSKHVKNDYHNRILQIITFWKTKYPEYYEVSVQEITEAELGSPDICWYNNKGDIVYMGLNIQFFKYLLFGKEEEEEEAEWKIHQL